MKHDWEYKKLTDLCAIQYGFAFDSSYFNDTGDGLPLIRIRDVVRGFSETYYSGAFPPEYIMKEGDYLIGMDGEFSIAQWKGDEALLNQRVCKITSKSDSYTERFAYYYLSRVLKEIENETPFVTVKHLSAKQLNQILTPVPPLPVQQQICSLLDKLSRVIEAKKEQLKELDNLAQAIFYDMFGDPVSNKKDWGYCTLAELITDSVIIYHLDGNHGGDYPRSEEFVGAGVPYIGANAIINGNVDFSMAKYLTQERAKQLRKGIAQNNDVLFAHNATVGPVAILKTNEEKVILSTSLTAYRCNEGKMLPYFLKAYMKSEWFVCQYKKVMKQATRNQVPITKQKEMLFILPPLPLQQSFAEKVEAIERQKELINQSIREVQTLFDSRMDYWFSD